MEAKKREKTKAELISELGKLQRKVSRLTRQLLTAKENQAPLREAEEQYRNLINSIPVGLYRNTPGKTGKFIMANPAIARMFGYESVEDFLRCSVAELYAEPSDRKKFSDKLLEQGYVTQEIYRFKRTDGTRFWGALTSRAVRDESGEIKYFDGMFEDVTRQRESEDRLRESEEQFRTLFELSRDALMILDREGFIDCNSATLSLFGSRSKKDFISKHPSEVSPPFQPHGEESLAAARKQIELAFREGSQFFEWVHQRQDGSIFSANVLLSKFELQGKEVLQATVRDITESKRVEAELKNSQQRLSDIINFLPVATFVIDREGRVTAWNQAMETLTGTPASAVLGQGNYEYSLPFYGERRPILIDLVYAPREDLERNYQQVRQQEGLLYAEAFVPKLGKNGRDLVGYAGVLRNSQGQPVGAIESILDITERKQAEEALKESKRQLMEIIDFLPVATFVIDREGKITAWNRAIEHLLGAKAKDMLGKGDHEYARPFYGERRPILIDLVDAPREELAEKYQHVEIVEGILRAEAFIPAVGEGRIMVGDAAALRDSHGNKVGAIECARDVTDYRRTEAELTTAKEAAEAANRAKSAFLAMMSHEIRTPMNAIIGMTEILAETELSDDQRSYAEIIMSSAGALLNIINDILDFSKIEAGKMDLAAKPFDFRKLIEELGQIFALKIDQKKIDLVINYEPDAPKDLIGDEMRLRQILTNLVGNAAKFTQEGHILIEAACKKKDERRLTLQVRVEDTGTGIPLAAQATIFDTFTQADSSSRRRYEGTGLGLAITRQLVHLMGGEIGFESQPGKGSAFFFEITLPLGEAAPEEAKSSADLSGIRVLVVDDNKVNRMVLRKQLTSWDMSVEECAYPQEALRIMTEAADAGRPFDVAILDYQMPQMDGIQLAEAIRENERLHHTVLIMLFSAMQQSNLEHLEQLGLAACLTKPVRTSLLRETIGTVWSARLQNQKLRMITFHGPSFEYGRSAGTAPGRQFPARVLLAEDNPANQKVAVRLLESLGCGVEVAGDGNAAIKMARTGDFDLIFMDCQMPDLDGFMATQKIRELEAGRQRLPIVAMTAYAMQGDRERCLEAGMDDYLTKPISKHRLQEMLERYLKVKAARPREKAEKLLIADADEKSSRLVYQSLHKLFPSAKIKTCADGLQTVALLGSFAPDFLVLDLELPHVHPAALVRFLREDERFSKTKVIALTGPETTDEGLQEIQALGLEGVIPKPLQADRVEEVILQSVRVKPLGTGPGPSGPAPPAAPLSPFLDETWPVIDDSVLENVTGGDSGLALEIMGFYKESLPKDVKMIEEAVLSEDVTAMARTAHSVKGAAANLGAIRLSRLAGKMELAAREEKPEEYREMAKLLPGRLEELLKEIYRRAP